MHGGKAQIVLLCGEAGGTLCCKAYAGMNLAGSIHDQPVWPHEPYRILERLFFHDSKFCHKFGKGREDMTAYYAGRCVGDMVITLAGVAEAVKGYGAAVTGGGTMVAETVSGAGAGLVPGTAVLVLAEVLVTADGVVTIV